MDSTDMNGLHPPLPPQQAVFAQGCIPPITQTNTRGHLSRHHITLIPLTQATRDQSRHTTITHKLVARVMEVMGVRQATFRLQGLVNAGVLPEISMERVEGVLVNHPLEFRNALVAR